MSSTSLKVPRPLKGTFLIGVTIIVLVSLIANATFLVWQLKRLLKIKDSSYTYTGGDVPRELPLKLRKVNMNFHDDPEHFRLGGKTAWAEWNTLPPLGNGFVYLGDAPYPYEVSMFHSLRCLNHIRLGIDIGDDDEKQTLHCLHYLMQTFLCNNDQTLEKGGDRKRIENGDAVANGGGLVHTCKDWTQVYDYLEKNHAKWTPEMEKNMRNVYDRTYNHTSREQYYPKYAI